MCGIAGIIGFSDHDQVEHTIQDMKAALKHRGPDGEGIWISHKPSIAFGHQRLSIIDLSSSGAQPMTSSDGRFVITYNGEFYNYREMRLQCEERGSIFKSHSDTEVIVECYRHWKTECFKSFSGMWAFVIYDKEENKVVFCRDPFGIKPLYYGYLEGKLYFASEPKGVRAADSRFDKIDDITVKLFEEYGYLDRGDWTFYSRIKRFPHAHYAVIDLDREGYAMCFTRYWSPPSEIKKIDLQDAACELRRLLTRSVELHLRSDVPVGACLSGGLDSSAIVCIGSTLLPAGNRFHTFTTKYPLHREFDESHWAQKVIDHTNAQPTYIEPSFDSFVSDYEHLVSMQDEPFGSTSIFAQYSVFKKISESRVKVILDGQGADEQLAGYHGYFETYLAFLLNAGRWMKYLTEGASLKKIHGYKFTPDWKGILQGIKRRISNNKDALKVNTPLNSNSIDEMELRVKEIIIPADNFEQLLTNLTTESNLPELLRYEDRDSMAFSIESRVPFLEPGIVNFLLSLPAGLKIRRGVTKAVLREALSGLVPDEVRLRVDKMGFPAPEKMLLKQAFNIDVAGPGDRKFRDIMLKRWRQIVLGKDA